MPNYRRYEVVSDWYRSFDSIDYAVGDIVIIIEDADLRDKQNGKVYEGGASRVRVEGPGPKVRPKVFFGESAWSDAERYASDLFFDQRHKAPVW